MKRKDQARVSTLMAELRDIDGVTGVIVWTENDAPKKVDIDWSQVEDRSIEAGNDCIAWQVNT